MEIILLIICCLILLSLIYKALTNIMHSKAQKRKKKLIDDLCKPVSNKIGHINNGSARRSITPKCVGDESRSDYKPQTDHHEKLILKDE